MLVCVLFGFCCMFHSCVVALFDNSQKKEWLVLDILVSMIISLCISLFIDMCLMFLVVVYE